MFGQNLISHFDSTNELDRSFNQFLFSLEKIVEMIEAFEEEGMAAEIVAEAFVSTDLPNTLLSSFTNEVASKLLRSSIEVMRAGGGSGQRYVWAALDITSKLHVNMFDTTDGKSESFIAQMPVSDGSFVGDIFTDVSVKKNLERFASENGAIVCWDLTNYLCDIRV